MGVVLKSNVAAVPLDFSATQLSVKVSRRVISATKQLFRTFCYSCRCHPPLLQRGRLKPLLVISEFFFTWTLEVASNLHWVFFWCFRPPVLGPVRLLLPLPRPR